MTKKEAIFKSQPISVSVQMDAASFHDFAAFDLLRHRKAWHRPLVFTAILLVSAGFCLSQVGQKDGAALLTVVLAVVALGVLTVLLLGVYCPGFEASNFIYSQF